MHNAVVFFDGFCILCNSFADFLITVDRKQKLRFSPLQGKTYAKLTANNSSLPANVDTIVFWFDEKAYVKSRAVLKALEYLGGVWSIAAIFRIIPTPVCDWIYDIVATNRYKWFGKNEACRIPSPSERERFLE